VTDDRVDVAVRVGERHGGDPELARDGRAGPGGLADDVRAREAREVRVRGGVRADRDARCRQLAERVPVEELDHVPVGGIPGVRRADPVGNDEERRREAVLGQEWLGALEEVRTAVVEGHEYACAR